MGTPVCKDCHKKVPTNAKIMVNKKTLADYRLCPSCYFFKFENQENQVVIKKNIKARTAVQMKEPTFGEYLELKGLNRYYVIKTIFDVKTLRQIIQQDKAAYRVETCKRRIKKLSRGRG